MKDNFQLPTSNFQLKLFTSLVAMLLLAINPGFAGERANMALRSVPPIAVLPVGQVNCETIVEFSAPPSLGICDFEYRIGGELLQPYTTTHDYEVVIRFNPSRMSFQDNGMFLSFTVTPMSSVEAELKGVLRVPPTPFPFLFTIVFNRLSAWSAGVEKDFILVVNDPDCDSNPVGAFNDLISLDPEYVDLRNTTLTNITDLVGAQILPHPNTACVNQSVNVLVDDQIVFDAAYCFMGSAGKRAQIALMPGARLVESGSGLSVWNLLLQDVDIFTCGTELAQGVVVEPGGRLRAVNTKFSDSRFGIQFMAANGDDFPELAEVTNCSFENNYVGVNIDLTGVASPANHIDFRDFSGNAFVTNASIKQPFTGMPEAVFSSRGFAGIVAKNADHLNLFGSGNTFTNLANGIVATNSNMNLKNMTFTGMIAPAPAYPLAGFGISAASRSNNHWMNLNKDNGSMSFTSCLTAVSASGMAGTVKKCTTNTVTNGIVWERSRNRDIAISENNITALLRGIRSFQNEPLVLRSEIKANRVNMTGTEPQGVIAVELQEDNGSSFGGGWKALGNDVTLQQGGIGFLYRHGSTGALNSNKVFNVNTAQNFRAMHMEYDHYSEASENTIDQTAPGSGFGSSQGITVNGCFLNDFECNCISHVGYGTDFYDINNSTNIKGNRYFSYNTGLVVGSAQRPDTYIGVQTHHGNWWDISSGILGARHFSSDLQILDKSKFVVDASQNAGFLPTRVPGTGWFFPQINEGQTFACERPCTSSVPMMTTPTAVHRTAPDALDEAVALDAMPTDSFPGSMNWKGAYRLYRNLLQHPEWLAYSPIYQNFKDQHAAGPVGILAYVAEQRAALFDVGGEPVDLINTLAEQAAAIATLDSLRQAGGTVDSLDYQSLVAEYAATQADYNDLLADWRDDRAGQIGTLLILNAAVSDTGVWVQNHKTLNHILLTATLNEEITAGQLDTLTGIANQCPLLGGDAVYEARSAVSYLTGASFDDDTLCTPSSERALPTVSNKANNFTLFPNPTSGSMYWLGLQGKTLDVKVYNRLGSLVLEKITDKPSVDLAGFPSGTYRVHIFDQNRLVLNQNIVLQRPE